MWFQRSVVYSGRAIIELDSPEVTLSGTFHFSSESGRLDVSVESVSPEEFPLMLAFTHSGGQQKIGGYIRVSIGAPQNPCKRLVFETSDGQLEPLWDPAAYTYGFNIDGQDCKLSFESSGWVYRSNHAGVPPKYWSVPLVNFKGPYQFRGPDEIRTHPMRLKSEQTKAGEAGESRPLQVIPFGWKNTLAFIEGLPDFGEGDNNETDAVLVAEVAPGDSMQFEDLDWYPHHLFLLIALGTGNPVSVPWLEFRNEDTTLACRYHVPFTRAPGPRGRDNLMQAGRLGQLLTEASNSPAKERDALMVALRNACRSCSQSATVEEMVTRTSIALDSLCIEYGTSKQDLLASCPTAAPEVRTVLRAAAKDIRDLAVKTPEEKKVLDTIEGRISNAAATEASFGLAVGQLCQHADFGFHDADVLQGYSKVNIDGSMRGWAFWITRLRGRTIHRGTFLPLINELEAYDLSNHLRDLLIRVIFKAFGYTGDYQPTPVIYPIAKATVDWVQSGTIGLPVLLPNICK